MEYITQTNRIPHAGSYDVIVAGGGVAGAAAAVAAARKGGRVLLIEKLVTLGGLATSGLINLFVPMCNGRGKQIIKGMAEEFLRLSIRNGFDTIPEPWQTGEPAEPTKLRYVTQFSAPIFSLCLAELLLQEKVDILYDTIVSDAVVTEKGMIDGVIAESKTGREYYTAKIIIDTTGDADVLYRAGVPTVQGSNYFSYFGKTIDMDSMKNAVEKQDVAKAYGTVSGGGASLYGHNQPENERKYEGTTNTDVTEYMLKNQMLALEHIKKQNRKHYDVVQLPTMPQFRTTRHIDGDYTLLEQDHYRHFEDSVGVICDFDRRDYLYEVPYRTLFHHDWKNVLTAGRSASAEGYGWDILRVIPPAILTGQAAGTAAMQSIRSGKTIPELDVAVLQKALEQDGIDIHFDDDMVPQKEAEDVHADIGHV